MIPAEIKLLFSLHFQPADSQERRRCIHRHSKKAIYTPILVKMKLKTFSSSVLLFVALAILVQDALAKFEPYKVLEVNRRASAPEIRKAYKKMAKEWHPDKNKDPNAEARFIEITKAYELLSDPDRRKQYDNHGITEDSPNFRQKHDYSQYGR